MTTPELPGGGGGDADLAAIAALSTTLFGRSLLTEADSAALRAAAALGTSATRDVGAAAGTVAAGDDARFRAAPPVHTAFGNSGDKGNVSGQQTLATATTIPASSLAVGTFLRYSLDGTLDTNAAQNPSGTFTSQHKINATIVGGTGQISASQTSVFGAGQPWSLEGIILVLATGAGGSVLIRQSRYSRNAAAAQSAVLLDQAVAAVDLSGGLSYVFTVASVTQSASNVFRLLGGFLEHVR